MSKQQQKHSCSVCHKTKGRGGYFWAVCQLGDKIGIYAWTLLSLLEKRYTYEAIHDGKCLQQRVTQFAKENR